MVILTDDDIIAEITHSNDNETEDEDEDVDDVTPPPSKSQVYAIDTFTFVKELKQANITDKFIAQCSEFVHAYFFERNGRCSGQQNTH